MTSPVKYPIGQQSFEVLRENGYLYVDKTRFLANILNGGQYFFLGRPRRFGKSLFLSMLKCFFQGKRHLFKGLYADSMGWDWEEYPVLYLDLNMEAYKTESAFDELIINHLEQWEEKYAVTKIASTLPLRFHNIIVKAHETTGKKVVVLVDEYDKSLVNNINNEPLYKVFQNSLSSLYSNFKSSADHLKLVFLTGVSRFGKVNVFSGLNNIDDISFDDRYNDICGLTEEELNQYFQEGIAGLAAKFGKSESDICKELKRNYDGYRFSPYGKDIYNPYSILKVMDKGIFDYFWIESGTPTLLAEQLLKFNVDLERQLDVRCTKEDLMSIEMNVPKITALLYQSGYLTIKAYDPASRLFSLSLPNEEVTRGFLDVLLPYYANTQGDSATFVVYKFVEEFRRGDVDGFMTRLQGLFASTSYFMKIENENNFHNALFILMLLSGLNVKTEYATSNGRIDLFIATDKYYYIIELKRDSSPEAALAQINEKGYSLPFSIDHREVIKIGVNFSTESRTITGWITER